MSANDPTRSLQFRLEIPFLTPGVWPIYREGVYQHSTAVCLGNGETNLVTHVVSSHLGQTQPPHNLQK